MNNRESHLTLKSNGTYVNQFGVLGGSGSQYGTYNVKNSTLTLSRDNGFEVTYSYSLGNEGKGTHQLSGKSLRLTNANGGFLLER